jgi:hypothetical protein
MGGCGTDSGGEISLGIRSDRYTYLQVEDVRLVAI